MNKHLANQAHERTRVFFFLPLSVRSACQHNVLAPVRHDVLLTYIEGTLGDELHEQNDRRALRYRANRDSEQVIIVKFSARRRTR